MAKEQLLRRLLSLPRQPAVVLMQVPHVWPHVVHPFFYTAEDLEGALASYYDVSSLSMRTSMFLLNVHQPTPGFLWNQTYTNRHPMDNGHKAMADLAVHLIQEVAVGLSLWPISQHELSWWNLPLPPPMHEGNYEPLVTTCLVGHKFFKMCIFNAGWQWLNEGTESKPKWGFVSAAPGNALVLRLGSPGDGDVASAAAANHGNATFPVLLQFLASYKSMGQADMDCLGGCHCRGKADGQLMGGQRISVTHMVRLDITWMKRFLPCDLRVTVLNDTRSDGHKFKVSGVVFAATNNLGSSHGVQDWVDWR
ncbi:hypothetical protein Vafri_15279 [Volvox africanus]|nr:hypothetical protein Vafri_15279 [Volvox africanus]